ncbi:hypothetical protein Dsin_023464 [Dipteronia sinensis]|uniref:Aminopeptidase P N-terminal domain-containing protein n=1 Tax=Dipteronia sinensis TaxID=43782 RepID=A0AAE0E126_9ROSI|nr:hypothetical protein Dsin_023464 [Dipteronia sinensis]
MIDEVRRDHTWDRFSRRKRLLELLSENSVAILATAPVKMMTDVVPYTYQQDADYLYITGSKQPGGLAVLSLEYGLCMFMPETSPHILPDMIGRSSKLFHNKEAAAQTFTDLKACQKADYYGKLPWVKSPPELKLLRESASIVCQALLRTTMYSKAHPYEGMLAAKFEYECKMRGAQRMVNDQKIEDGDLVLMDVRCELHGYVRMLLKGLKEIGIANRNGTDPYNELNPTSIGLSEHTLLYSNVIIWEWMSMIVSRLAMNALWSYERTLEPGVLMKSIIGIELHISFIERIAVLYSCFLYEDFDKVLDVSHKMKKHIVGSEVLELGSRMKFSLQKQVTRVNAERN